jgi:hypothetical protein
LLVVGTHGYVLESSDRPSSRQLVAAGYRDVNNLPSCSTKAFEIEIITGLRATGRERNCGNQKIVEKIA